MNDIEQEKQAPSTHKNDKNSQNNPENTNLRVKEESSNFISITDPQINSYQKINFRLINTSQKKSQNMYCFDSGKQKQSRKFPISSK